MTTFYVFGESQNDTGALEQLLLARAEADGKDSNVVRLRKPLIQQKGVREKTRYTNAQKVQSAILGRQRAKRDKEVVIVAHQDCDQVEPAHRDVDVTIRNGLKSLSMPIIAAAPAFEMEAWWYLWPDAVAKVCSSWKRLRRSGGQVGPIENVKEVLTRELKGGKITGRLYKETDAPLIAKNVRELRLIDVRNAVSESYEHFEAQVRKHL